MRRSKASSSDTADGFDSDVFDRGIAASACRMPHALPRRDERLSNERAGAIELRRVASSRPRWRKLPRHRLGSDSPHCQETPERHGGLERAYPASVAWGWRATTRIAARLARKAPRPSRGARPIQASARLGERFITVTRTVTGARCEALLQRARLSGGRRSRSQHHRAADLVGGADSASTSATVEEVIGGSWSRSKRGEAPALPARVTSDGARRACPLRAFSS